MSFELKEATAAGQEGADVRLEAAKEEYDYAFLLPSSLMECHLGVKKDDDE